MGFFDSKAIDKKTSQAAEQQPTATADDGSLAISNAIGPISISGGAKKSTTIANIDIELTDFGAVQAGINAGADALEFADEQNRRSLEFAADTFGDAAALGEKAIETAEDATRRALDSGLAISSDALEFGRDALESVEDTNRRALEQVTGLATDLTDDVLEFGSALISLASDSQDGAEELIRDVIGANSDALASAFASAPGGGVEASQKIVIFVAIAALAVAGGVAIFGRK